MKFVAVFLSLFFFGFQNTPFKAKEEFELKLDFQFRPRPKSDAVEMKANTGSTPLPYLSMQLNVLRVRDDEYRVRIVDNRGNVLTSKMLSKSTSVKFDIGYTDDVKDHVTADKYFVNFYGKDKKLNRQIAIRFDADGAYFVNEEQRGRI
jgi:hypothetical protein